VKSYEMKLLLKKKVDCGLPILLSCKRDTHNKIEVFCCVLDLPKV
jgi:hypothetical protein